MMALPTDYTLVGTVLAIAIAILLLSGLALYVAFRVRETLRDERGGSARLVKVSFLIGLLFLSGGVFYFFAAGFAGAGSGSTQSVSSISTVSTSATSVTSASTSTASSSSTTFTTTSVAGGSASMSVTYPSSVNVGEGFYVQFSIYNSGSGPLNSVSLDLGSLGLTFKVVNATLCNPGCSPASLSGSVVEIGTLNPGSTILTVGLKAPSSPAQFSGSASLNYQGEAQPVTVTVTIRVSGRP